MKKTLTTGSLMVLLSAAAAYAGGSTNGITVIEEAAGEQKASYQEGTAGGGYRTGQQDSNGITFFESAAPKATVPATEAGAAVSNGITVF